MKSLVQLPPFENDTTIEIKFPLHGHPWGESVPPRAAKIHYSIYNLADIVTHCDTSTKTYIYKYTQIAATQDNIVFRVSVKRKTNKNN